MSSTTMQKDRQSGVGMILDLSWGQARTAALVTGLELDVFTHIASGLRTQAAVSEAAGADERGVGTLLLALASMGLLSPDGDGGYDLSPEAAAYLVRGEPTYLGDLRHLHRDLNFRVWPRLTEAVRSGDPCDELFARDTSDTWRKVLPYLNALGEMSAEWVTSLVEEEAVKAPRVLDVGCGSGVYGHAVASRIPGARVVGLDRPDLVKLASEKAAEKQCLAGATSYRGGDFMESPWGSGYDVVLLSNVLHGYGPVGCRELLQRARNALRAGGKVVVHEFIPDVSSPADMPIASLLGLQMLLTSGGASHSAEDYQRWLGESGFSGHSRHLSPSGPTTAVIATRTEAATPPGDHQRYRKEEDRCNVA